MSNHNLEEALQGLNIGTFSANEAVIRVVRALKSATRCTYQDLAIDYGIAPSRAHHLFAETAGGEQSNRKIDGDLLERIAQKLDLSIDELLRLGRVADGESIERILKARGVNRGFLRHVIIADIENLYGGTGFPRIELSRWPIYRDEESAMLTSHYLGLRGVGETTASYYLFFRCLNDELRPVSSFAYPMTPVAIETLRRKGYNIDIPSYKPEQKYRDYLFAVSELAKSVNQDPMNVAYALRQKQVFD